MDNNLFQEICLEMVPEDVDLYFQDNACRFDLNDRMTVHANCSYSSCGNDEVEDAHIINLFVNHSYNLENYKDWSTQLNIEISTVFEKVQLGEGLTRYGTGSLILDLRVPGSIENTKKLMEKLRKLS